MTYRDYGTRSTGRERESKALLVTSLSVYIIPILYICQCLFELFLAFEKMVHYKGQDFLTKLVDTAGQVMLAGI